MKIKWKIVLSAVGIILLLTIAVLSFTNAEMNSLVKTENSEELENYSNMGMQLIESAYSGDWSVKNDQLYKGDTLLNENYEVIDKFTDGTQVLATIFMNDTRIATNVVSESGERQINT